MRKLLWIVAAVAVVGVIPADAAQRFTLETGLALKSNNIFRGSDRGPMGLVLDLDGTYRLSDQFDILLSTCNYARIDNEVGLGEGIYEVGLRYRPNWALPVESIDAGYRFFNVSRRVDRYSFPAENTFGNDTQEWYWGVDFEVPGYLRLEGAHDFDRRVGTYLRVGAGNEYELGTANLWEFHVDAGLGFDFGRGVDTFRDGLLGLGFFWTPNDNLKIGPTLELVFPSDDVDPTADGLTPVFGLQTYWTPNL